ncbi:hypothetical protein [Treponema sp.]|uniref:hypothetical protein n=1 Tax=Treponema sp. TaxID=166 RepID=UPI00298E679F|nr:hypothetical protein [Treponema sp.]MCR5612106.1 hypothetical protein [Treponema sp.]
MNSIPLIFNERQINRTVLGGTKGSVKGKMPVSVILLNSGGNHLRIQNLENLQNCGFEDIISMETNSENYNLEDFVNKFPSAKFIIPQEKVTAGDLINIGMAECESEYVLVLRDTLQISSFVVLPNAAQKLAEKQNYCYVPRLVIDKNQPLSTNFIPFVQKGVFKVESTLNASDSIPTLYPLDFIGMYNRKKFIQLGGFDYTIESPYWQNLDLAFRAWLWGEKILSTTSFQLSYLENGPVEDTTSNLSQFRFYLKNLAPVFRLDHGEIPKTAFLRTMFRSACGFVETLNQFSDAREWVLTNQYRFKTDAAGLISGWGVEK